MEMTALWEASFQLTETVQCAGWITGWIMLTVLYSTMTVIERDGSDGKWIRPSSLISFNVLFFKQGNEIACFALTVTDTANRQRIFTNSVVSHFTQ